MCDSCKKLNRLLELKENHLVIARRNWVSAAEKALRGDLRDLKMRMELAKIKNWELLQSRLPTQLELPLEVL